MNLKSCLMAASLCLVAGIAFAQGPEFPSPNFRGPQLFGAQSYQDATPIPPVGGTTIAPVLEGAPMPLGDCNCQFYQRVCYKDKCKIAPCAQVLVVSVLDPCSTKCDCETKCVQVKICAPPCDCPKVKVSRSGRHTRYDFGKYAVDIYSNRNGTVTVDYDA